MYGDYAYIALAVATPIALLAAFYDLKHMIIPNWLSIAAAALFVALVFIALPQDQALWRLAGAGIVFAVCFVFYLIGAMGGGDVKAATAFSLMVAPQDVAVVLVILSATALIGMGVVAVLRRTSFADGGWKVWSDGAVFPYGVALAATLLIYLSLVAVLLS